MPITPTPGADALAAGMALVPGTGLAADLEEYINQTRDYIAQRTSAVVPVAKGGTGATTATAARTNLDVPSNADLATKLTRTTAQYNADFAARDSDIASKFPISGGTVSGNMGVTGGFYVGTHPGATFGYTVAYINGDNQLCAGVSSRRFKKTIVRDAEIPDVFEAPFASYVMRKDPDGITRYGYIAEDLDAYEGTRGFVVYDDEGRPLSYDMIGLLLAQAQQAHRDNLALRQEVTELQVGLDAAMARLDALEARA